MKLQFIASLAAIAGALFALHSSLRASAAERPPLPRFETPYGAKVNTAESFRRAVEDLIATFGPRYPKGAEYLAAHAALEKRLAELKAARGTPKEALVAAQRELDALVADALLSNPLLVEIRQLLLVRRHGSVRSSDNRLGLPQNFAGNAKIYRYDWAKPAENVDFRNEICVLSPVRPDGKLTTLYKPADGAFVGDVDLHFSGKRLLFSMPDAYPARRFQIWEINADGSGLRQITRDEVPPGPGLRPPYVDNADACYLPDGGIVFSSTRATIGVPCVAGGIAVGNLYRMDADGKNIRRLTVDQVDDWCPTVLGDGSVLYLRWEYSDIPHFFSRRLFVMNPDGTNQRALYGSNSYWPNGQFYARPIPGQAGRFISLVTGHHGIARRGELILFEPGRGERQAEGVVQRIPGWGLPVKPVCGDCPFPEGRTALFTHPYPLDDKYFVVSAQLPGRSRVEKGPDGKPVEVDTHGIYLVDVFDNMVPLHVIEDECLFEPIPLRPSPTPPVIPDRSDRSRKTATVYLGDVYAGSGLKGVPRGTVKRLRVYAFHFGYPGAAVHEDGAAWDVHRILGTVPVEEDGSAAFTVPAMVPLAVQPLDEHGQAVQLMRSWFTAMPGESLSCVGCHERQSQGPVSSAAKAMRRAPSAIEPFHGPERNYAYRAEVEPVVKKYCTHCHDGPKPPKDHPNLKAFLFRPMLESDMALTPAMEYHADTSPLIQMLRKGHHGVRLDRQSYERLVTWLDLNAPQRGSYRCGKDLALLRQQDHDLHGGPALDFEQPVVAPVQLDDPRTAPAPTLPEGPPPAAAAAPRCAGWPIPPDSAKAMQGKDGPYTFTLNLDGEPALTMVRIPAGQFIMGDPQGSADEAPCLVRIAKPFWISATEVDNGLFRRFAPEHDSGNWLINTKDMGNMGAPLNHDRQPATRLSWQRANAFCAWLSKTTGGSFALPSEAEWEWACRAGSDGAFAFGPTDADWTPFANLAGAEAIATFARDPARKDKHYATAPVGSYRPNAWGLFDMHGNVAEWTRSPYLPYPYKDSSITGSPDPNRYVVVRGGSFRDIPHNARAGYRRAYRTWHGVIDVGFRIVCEEPLPQTR